MSLQYECVRGAGGEEAFVLLSLFLSKRMNSSTKNDTERRRKLNGTLLYYYSYYSISRPSYSCVLVLLLR